MAGDSSGGRAGLVGRGLRLEFFTVGWNVVEAIVAIVAAVTAGSVALLGFGADSVIESASGGILIWRLVAESRATDAEAIARLDRTAHKLVGASLLLLAAYVAGDAAHALWVGQHPEPSRLGMGVTLISLVVMMWLARAKRRAAKALDSRALEADAFQTTVCWWLSLITLTGIGLNAALGWWWADPVAALGMTVFLVHEGREAWHGDDCCA
jgi:divalent metal cation (Fe/Co/Zn/Cd) transporter